MIKYIGSKRKLLPAIASVVDSLGPLQSVLDLFAGTTRVGRMLKKRGYLVHSNDTAAWSEVLGKVAIALDRREVDDKSVSDLIEDLQSTPPQGGWFTKEYCSKARYIQPFNGAKIEAIRTRIEEEVTEEPLRSIALTSLLLAADKVDSTTGVQMAYLKSWAARSYRPLLLEIPEMLDGPGSVSSVDAAQCARDHGPVDLVYVDPPYNQHSYLGNYHLWETLLKFDDPETYGVACKRIDCKIRKSPWNSKRLIHGAFQDLVEAIDARWILVSFNNEGFLPAEDVEEVLSTRGEVTRTEIPHDRYVGARIGIHNPEGEKVGTISHLKNTEYLFAVKS